MTGSTSEQHTRNARQCALCRDLFDVDRDDVQSPHSPSAARAWCGCSALHVRRYRTRVAAFARHGMVLPAPDAHVEARHDVCGNQV